MSNEHAVHFHPYNTFTRKKEKEYIVYLRTQYIQSCQYYLLIIIIYFFWIWFFLYVWRRYNR